MSLMARVALENIHGLEEFSQSWVQLACFLSLLVACYQFIISSLGLGKTISRFVYPFWVLELVLSASIFIECFQT